jgi:hypothetical protein
MKTTPIKLNAKFYASESGSEPVRIWLKSLSAQEKRTIGEDIKNRSNGVATWNAAC